MSEIEKNLNYFKKRFPDVYSSYSNYGKTLHENGGPLEEKTRWLIKISVSATESYPYALRTHMKKATESGCSEDEILHAILLIAPTVGFPKMMEALLVFREFFNLEE